MNSSLKNPRFIAIIQARMGSTRLPGKVMKDLVGKPVLWHIIQRVTQSSLINGIIVASTTNHEDNIIESACESWDIPVFRGSSDDVLKRFCDTIHFIELNNPKITYIVRITADCPLIDPIIINEVISIALSGRYDYVSNTLQPTFPDGLDVEIVSRESLFIANTNAQLLSDREHVTPFIKREQKFKKFNHKYPVDLSALRWTLDNPEDYDLIKIIYETLNNPLKLFLMSDIIQLFNEKPELYKINSHLNRDEGYKKSLYQDFIKMEGNSQ